MMHRKFRALVIIPCAALLFGAFALQAATVKSERFAIPFQFQAQKKSLPAGEYEIRQTTSEGFALLVNTKTGEKVELLRPANTHQEGKARLEFEERGGQRSLKRLL